MAEMCAQKLPTGLEVRRFAKARAPELRSLHHALKAVIKHNRAQEDVGKATFLPAPHRSLRRRTTSHNRRKPFWWTRRRNSNEAPSFSNNDKNKQKQCINSSVLEKAEASNGCCLHDSDTVLIKRGVGEGEAGQSVIHTKPLKGFIRKRKAKAKKPLSRRLRRRIELKGGSDGQGGRSSDGTQRLATHLWHSKRFEMNKMWGYWLAKGLPGRGRGSRALLKMANEGALVHDASYHNAIEMKGRMDALLETLELVLEPSPRMLTSSHDALKAPISCACYDNAMIHQLGKVPYKPVAPVMVIWRPSSVQLQSHDLRPLTSVISSSRCENTDHRPLLTESQDEERQLWIWVHAAAFDITLQVLEAACHEQVTKHGKPIVSCQSRKGELARLDLLGARAFQVLQKVLIPVTSPVYVGASKNASKVNLSEPLKACDKEISRLPGLQKVNKLPDKAILSLTVYDPRDLPQGGPIRFTHADKGLYNISQSADTFAGESLNQVQSTTSSVLANDFPPTPSESYCRRSKFEDNIMVFQGQQLSDCPALWTSESCRNGPSVKPPVSVKSLCLRRHKERLSYFHINHEAHTPTNPEMYTHSGGSTCPILLLKHLYKKPSACRWSVILPMSWVRALWLPLLSTGAQAVGQREYRWFLTDAGLPSFPFDFPDVPLNDISNGLESTVSRGENQQLLSKDLPEYFSPSPPWMCMVESTEDYHMLMASESETSADMVHERDASGELTKTADPIQGFRDGLSHSKRNGQIGKRGAQQRVQRLNMRFPGFVARTKLSLDTFLKENKLGRLLIFPGSRNDSRHFMQEELRKQNLVWQAASGGIQKSSECTSIINKFKELNSACFLRVLIRAPRKGVLKERAIIYLPTVQDLNSWFCRSNKWQGVKELAMSDVTHKSMKKYASSKCSNTTLENIQAAGVVCKRHAEDKDAKLSSISNRLSIGFVTSLAPRGSIKDVACAFVELNAVGKIRSMQLADKRWGTSKEIFCLFKNERSDILRPSLASIVLEVTDDVT
ncbi:hypothetical protein O6H91_09G099700 [Diphasiastrum complanatum]|uniref:Uncharacterized protein n=1 Tax=Diphasiastrum complanatum TaxID=34168 RepID=A0ACC2CTG4_DIPCM|nr:hypothetical protein O6H91_09G099700 [Diphasiastrum complanatum]